MSSDVVAWLMEEEQVGALRLVILRMLLFEIIMLRLFYSVDMVEGGGKQARQE